MGVECFKTLHREWIELDLKLEAASSRPFPFRPRTSPHQLAPSNAGSHDAKEKAKDPKNGAVKIKAWISLKCLKETIYGKSGKPYISGNN